MRLIECKLAKLSDSHLMKAQEQLETGLQHLISVFRPQALVKNADDDRPDQRYWWLQLHRLIATKTVISRQRMKEVLSALERLSEGDFDIEWRATALTFWTDRNQEKLSSEDPWSVSIEGGEMEVGVVSGGSELVRILCSEQDSPTLPWPESSLSFEGVAPVAVDLEIHNDEEREPSHGIQPDNKSEIPETTTNTETEPKKATVTDVIGNTVPERILLGLTIPGSRQVYWEFGHKELSNRHMLIFGTSGMGKTYAIQCLLAELARCSQNSLIIDYTNGFLPNQVEPIVNSILHPKQHIVRNSPLPINPFTLQSMNVEGIPLDERDVDAAKRISSIFRSVYDLGDQQLSILIDAVTEGISTRGEQMSLRFLEEILNVYLEDDSRNKATTRSTISKIRPFILENPFSQGSKSIDWESIFTDPEQR